MRTIGVHQVPEWMPDKQPEATITRSTCIACPECRATIVLAEPSDHPRTNPTVTYTCPRCGYEGTTRAFVWEKR